MTTASVPPARLGRRAVALALIAGLALLLATACGDEEDASSSSRQGTTPTPTATPTPSPPATGTSPATPEPTPVTYEALTSYRYEVTMTIATEAFDDEGIPAGLGLESADLEVRVRGMWVGPDSEHTRTTANLGAFTVEVESITIDGQQWTREPDGDWRRTSATLPGGIPGDIDVRPGSVFGNHDWTPEEIEALVAAFAEQPYESETVNGMSARHYTFAVDEFARLFAEHALFTDGEHNLDVQIDLWLSEEFGVPIAMVLTGTLPDGTPALEFTLELFDLNDPSLSIDPPED